MSRKISRRQVLKTALTGVAAGVTGRILPASALRRVSANERIGLGIIGVGGLGVGGHHLGRVLRMPDFELLAVCDVDRARVDKAVAKSDGKAQGYKDYRKLLERKDIDAVIIATPDHWHALTAQHACMAGKDVYCEKPLSLTVAEGRAMSDTARRYDRVFQTGTQQRSDYRFRWACELVQNGKLGKIDRVHVVTGVGKIGKAVPDGVPPEGLDFDFWLGPAPVVPYNPKRCHYDFRWWYDYSGGRMTDWGAHHHDIAQWALGMELSGPIGIDGKGSWPDSNVFETATDYEVDYTYANGVKMLTTTQGRNGIRFFGEKGELFVARGAIEARPKEILEDKVGTMPIKLPVSNNHHGNFVDCIRSRKRAISDVELSHRSATVCHLGNISMLLGRKLEWDPDKEQFVGDTAANRMLSRAERQGWRLGI